MSVELIAVKGLPEIRSGDDLAQLIATHAELREGDVIVVAQKAVSKSESMLRDLREIVPGDQASDIASRTQRDARLVQLILDESTTVLRDDPVLIVETRHGFVCANAGIDRSNVDADGNLVSLLPQDADASASRLRSRFAEVAGAEIGVIISDTFGRAWGLGIVNVALGVAGFAALVDHRGRPDDHGREMYATIIAVADEIASAAELVMGKTRRIPAVIVRGLTLDGEPGRGQDLIRPIAEDLFR